ncbi:MAG TPA: hypothetical protein VKI65_07340 [Gemmataceae bacterium]|nr:hypothetical protein [Gemmataceae bacterium]
MMCTPVLLTALTILLTPETRKEAPNWRTDYGPARNQAQMERRPLAVFVGSGKAGWEKLARDGKLGKDIEGILAANYVCVYVDANTRSGRRLATALEIEEPLGIVISDSGGDYMAFHHEGDLAKPDLERYLKRYSDPSRDVITTETNPPRSAPIAQPAAVDWSPGLTPRVSRGRSC